jgi:GT2 family glycosyltransferase
MSVGVVLPVRDNDARFQRALQALGQASPRADEVVVVLDGPVPDAARLVRQAGFTPIELQVRSGPAAARNAGVRAIHTDVLLFVDADVAVSPDLVARVRARLADPSVHAVVGCYDDAPPETNFFSQYKNLLQRFVHLNARSDGSTFWGACGAIRRPAFVDAGGFDERFDRPSVEDIDLGYRLRARGQRIVFDPSLQVTHLKRWTLTSLVKSDVLRRAMPWTWLMMRESRIESDLNLRYSSRVAGMLSLVLGAALVASPFVPHALVVALAAAVGLAAIDRSLFAFFRARRGTVFAVAAAAWHWVYYAYSTVAFVVAVALYPVLGRRLVRRDGPDVAAESKRRDVA